MKAQVHLFYLLFFQLAAFSFAFGQGAKMTIEQSEAIRKEKDAEDRCKAYAIVYNVQYPCKKPPLLERAWNDMFGDSDFKTERKYMKKLLNDPNDPGLSAFIRELESEIENPEKVEALRDFPFMYYFLLAVWYGCYKPNGKEKAYVYYKTACDLGNMNALPFDDQQLITKFMKHAERNKDERDCFKGYALSSESDLIRFADAKRLEHDEKVRADVKTIVDQKDLYSTEVVALAKESMMLALKIDSLRNLQNSKKISIENLSSGNYEAALREVQALKESKALELPGSVTKNLSGGAILKATDGAISAPLNPALGNEGFRLGTFCTPEIKSSTKDIFEAIMEVIDFKAKYDNVPDNYKDSIVIEVTIVGKADGDKVIRDAKGNCTLRYKDIPPVSGRYFLYPDTLNLVKVDIKQNDAICDAELAYLRARCANDQITEVIGKAGFPKGSVKTKLISKVFDEKGDKFRGVDVNVEIKNLFLHNLQTIKALQKQKQVIDTQIAELEKKIADKDNQIREKLGNLEQLDQRSVSLRKEAEKYGGPYTPRPSRSR